MSDAGRGLIFATPTPRFFSIPAGASFLESLALGLLASLDLDADPFALADAQILLPTLSAGEALCEHLNRLAGRSLLLPNIRALGDLSPDDDIPLPLSLDQTLPPEIGSFRRRVALANLVQAKARAEHETMPFAVALKLADALATLLDQTALAEGGNWEGLVAAASSANLPDHWLRAAQFLEIIWTYWPQFLDEEGLSDPATRRVAASLALARRWTVAPPTTPVILAGSTGVHAPVRALMRAIAQAPKGAVVFPGLDIDLDPAAWDAIDPPHPQRPLKTCLTALELDRTQISDWPSTRPAQNPLRARLVQEALRPADHTADWLERLALLAAERHSPPRDFVLQAWSGLHWLEATNEEEEASLVALIAAETVAAAPVPNDGSLRVAVISPDETSLERIAIKLARLGLDVTHPAAASFRRTLPGRLLADLCHVALEENQALAIARLLHNPLVSCGCAPALAVAARRLLDQVALRGKSPPVSFAALPDLGPHQAFAAALDACLAGPLAARADPDCVQPFAHWLRELLVCAEALAATDVQSGAEVLWAGDAGDCGARLLRRLLDESGDVPEMDFASFCALLPDLLAARVPGLARGSDPRVRLMAPLQARLCDADLVILVGLDEGLWPAAPDPDPFLGSALRRAAGLADADERLALAAHDFAQFASGAEVVFSRALKRAGTPQIASRWLWRLETLTRGALGGQMPPETSLITRARQRLNLADRPAEAGTAAVAAPRPAPAATYRPRRLPVTAIEKLARDPYAVYAERILGLRPWRPYGPDRGPAAFGSVLHKALELFALDETDPNIATLVAQCLTASDVIEPPLTADHLMARLRPHLEAFRAWHDALKQNLARAAVEVSGQTTILINGAPFELTARADRIDVWPSGAALISDIKTGKPPTLKQTKEFSPQLPLTAAILDQGGFAHIKAVKAEGVRYWEIRAFGTGAVDDSAHRIEAPDELSALIEDVMSGTTRLLSSFANPNTPYLSKPRPMFAKTYADYDQLARRAEWANVEESE